MRTDPPARYTVSVEVSATALELRGTAPLEGEKGSRQPNPNSKAGQSQGQSIVGMKDPWHYRNEAVVVGEEQGKLSMDFSSKSKNIVSFASVDSP